MSYIKDFLQIITRKPVLLISILALPTAMIGVHSLALFDGSTAFPQVAREMRYSGDWITPHLINAAHLDKPPLVYWLIGITQQLIGEQETAARIWPALAYWLTIPLIGGMGAQLYGRRAGWLSALVYGTCVGPYLFSRLVGPDVILCLWIVLAIFSYIKSTGASNKYGGFFLFSIFGSIGLAGLTKGVLGMGIPAGVVGLHALISGHWKSFFPGEPLAASLLC